MSNRTTVIDNLKKLEGFENSQRAAIGMTAASGIIGEAEKLEERIENDSLLTDEERFRLLVSLHNGTALAIATIVGQHVLSLAHDPSRKKG